jgi:putative phosphoesterase
MIIGILSDIHGNSEALKAVLLDARKANVTHLLILGDMVGYYYNTREVFTLLGDWENRVMIKGNHEVFLIGIWDGTIDSESIRKKYGSSLDIASRTLPDEARRTIKELKSSEIFCAGDTTIKICHGSPWDINQYIYPDSDPSLLQQCDIEGVDYLFLGHTHYPFIYAGNCSIVANPGSVGQSRIHGGIADWAILDTLRDVYVPKQTKYNTVELQKTVKEIDPHLPYLYKVLER